MKIIIPLGIVLVLAACTFSINMVHTKGSASDVIEESSSASPDIKPVIEIPTP
jgi:hypothetical protein